MKMTENVRRQADGWERRALTDLREARTAEAVSAYVAHDAVKTGKDFEVNFDILVAYRIAELLSTGATRSCSPTAAPTWTRSTATPTARRPTAAGSRDPASRSGSTASIATGRWPCPRSSRAGQCAVPLENDRDLGLTMGCAVQLLGVDPEMHTVTLRTPDNRDVTLDVRHYDAIDYGYDDRPQGPGAERRCQPGARPWRRGAERTYTAMSRGREENIYYTPSSPRVPDEHGRRFHEERPDELAERLERSWERSGAADSTLDYERLDEAAERMRELRERDLRDRELGHLLGFRHPEPGPMRSPTHALLVDHDDLDPGYDYDRGYDLAHDLTEEPSPGVGGPAPL